MRQVAVRHAALLLAGVLLASAGIFTWLVGRPAARPVEAAPSAQPATDASGAALFEEYCASCHQADRLRPDASDPTRRHDMELFLQDHGNASDADDRLILDYLSLDGRGVPGTNVSRSRTPIR